MRSVMMASIAELTQFQLYFDLFVALSLVVYLVALFTLKRHASFL